MHFGTCFIWYGKASPPLLLHCFSWYGKASPPLMACVRGRPWVLTSWYAEWLIWLLISALGFRLKLIRFSFLVSGLGCWPAEWLPLYSVAGILLRFIWQGLPAAASWCRMVPHGFSWYGKVSSPLLLHCFSCVLQLVRQGLLPV